MDVNFTRRFWRFSKKKRFYDEFWRSERWSTERVARNFEKSQLYEGKTLGEGSPTHDQEEETLSLSLSPYIYIYIYIRSRMDKRSALIA